MTVAFVASEKISTVAFLIYSLPRLHYSMAIRRQELSGPRFFSVDFGLRRTKGTMTLKFPLTINLIAKNSFVRIALRASTFG